MSKSGSSEEKTDLFGNKYIQHYDEYGNKAGTSEKKTGIFGDTYTQHYDKYGNKAGTSEQKTGIFGDTYTQHYDKDYNKSGTSEQKTGIFGDTYTQHYDKYGSKSGTSETRTGIFGDTYTQHYGSSGGYSGTSSSYSDSYSNSYDSSSDPYASVYSTPAVSLPQAPNKSDLKLQSSKGTYSDKELAGIEYANLKDEKEKMFLWYAAQLLLQKTVKFSTFKYGEGMWEINVFNESYDSDRYFREEENISYLTEHGFGWGTRKSNGNHVSLTYQNEYPNEKPTLRYVDAFLKRNGIEFSSAMFARMSGAEYEEIENKYKAASVANQKAHEKMHQAKDLESFAKNKNSYLSSKSNSIILMLIGWVIFSFLTLANIKIRFLRDLDPNLIFSGVNLMVGSWLLTRPDEYAVPVTRLSAVFFAVALGTLGYTYNIPGTVLALIVAIGIVFFTFRVKAQKSAGILVAVVSVLASLAENFVFYGIEFSTYACWAVYGISAIISIVGLVNLVDFFILRANGKQRIKFKVSNISRPIETYIFRKQLLCLAAGLAIVVFIMILPFVDNLYVCIGAYALMLAAGIIFVNYRYTITNMARNLIMLPTTVCLLLGLVGCNIDGSHIDVVMQNAGIGWMTNLSQTIGNICMRVTTVLYAPYQMALDFLAKDYLMYGNFTSKDAETLYNLGSGMTTGFSILGIFLLVFAVCSLGAIIGSRRTKPKNK